jgi:integrase
MMISCFKSFELSINLEKCHRSFGPILKIWVKQLKLAKVEYSNLYQMRHTYASMLLPNGENILWVASQLGHVGTEMVIRTYGKWIRKE